MADAVVQEVTGLRRDVGALTGAVEQVLTALEAQTRLLTALMEAVTVPGEGDGGLAEAMAQIVALLLRQGDQLVAIRAGVEGRSAQARG